MNRRRRVTGGGPPERWEPAAPSLRAAKPAEEQAPWAGTEEAARAVEVPARVAEMPARAAEASGSATVSMSTVASAPVEPSRKRKRGFSTLR
jgi:hypothetical protein